MKKLISLLLVPIFVLWSVIGFAGGPIFSGGGGGTAAETTVSTTNFDGNLSGTDTDVLTALETLDDIALGGDTTETNQDDAWAAVGGSGTESGIDVTYQDATDDVDFIIDVTPSSGSATLEVAEDAIQVKYDASLTEGASGLGIAADAISEAYIADDGIDSEHYNDGSIDAIHLAADVIDETKIADDGICEPLIDLINNKIRGEKNGKWSERLCNRLQVYYNKNHRWVDHQRES